MIDDVCVIFAGGRSSRMGRDKALLPFAGYNTLTEYQYRRLQKIFRSVYISCKDRSKFDFEADFIEDIPSQEYAPTNGFLALFQQLEYEHFFVLSVDTPFVTEEEFVALFKSDTQRVDATIAKTESGIQPMCGIYHRSLEGQFLKSAKEGNHKLTYLLQSSKTNFVDLSSERFMNLNYEDQYKKALQQIKKEKI